MPGTRRKHFRLRYPAHARPTVVVAGTRFSVIDLSEKGLRILGDGARYPSVGETCEATLHLEEGPTEALAGRVIRITPTRKECVLELSKGIPQKRVVDEQRRLIKKYRL